MGKHLMGQDGSFRKFDLEVFNYLDVFHGLRPPEWSGKDLQATWSFYKWLTSNSRDNYTLRDQVGPCKSGERN